MQQYSQAIEIFNQCFKADYQSELVCGGHEPIYIPSSQYYPWDRIIFAHGYFASAIHEISHWCIAGRERRRQVDFGYWYAPDGRNATQQQAFENVEIKPQALEWILCRSANFKFNVSLDNLSGDLSAAAKSAEVFKDNIYEQVQVYLKQGLSIRAQIISDGFIHYYRKNNPLQLSEFKREEL